MDASPPDSYLGLAVTELFKRRKIDLPSVVVSIILVYMRLNLTRDGAIPGDGLAAANPIALLMTKSNATTVISAFRSSKFRTDTF